MSKDPQWKRAPSGEDVVSTSRTPWSLEDSRIHLAMRYLKVFNATVLHLAIHSHCHVVCTNVRDIQAALRTCRSGCLQRRHKREREVNFILRKCLEENRSPNGGGR